MRYFIPIILLLTILGCSESVTSTYDLTKSGFTKAVKDSIVVEISRTNSTLQLTGDLSLIDGECEVILYDPNIDTLIVNEDTTIQQRIIYNKIFQATDNFSISEYFEPVAGTYKLYYLVANFNGVAPSGSISLYLINEY